MKSDILHIDHQDAGFRDALAQTEKAARFRGLSEKETLRLRICAEEMLGLARSITGEMKADFRLESEGKRFELHMSTETVMDKEKRYQLISSASSRKNEAAKGFLGMLRDRFEEAMTAEADRASFELPANLGTDVPDSHPDDTEWDRYEKSILKRLADEIKISVRGRTVELTVSKRFD